MTSTYSIVEKISVIKMAWLCTSRFKLCAYFLIFTEISSVFTLTDYERYELYNVDGQKAVFQDAGPIGVQEWTEHDIQKRDVNVETNISTPDQKTNNTTLLKEQTGANNAQNKTDAKNYPEKQKSNKIHKQSPKLDVNLEKNVGVNGTGQRKYSSNTITKLTESSSGVQSDMLVPIKGIKQKVENGTGKSDDAVVPAFPNEDEESEAFNKTLSLHNITMTRTDSHSYYNSSMTTDPTVGRFYWVDLSNKSDVKYNELLSNSHRRAATVKLLFEFPFYGHTVRNVTIATGGFLYTGDYVHSWLAATQYIAPLMANFDTSLSNASFIRHYDNGTAFTVEWVQVALQDRPQEGSFTFQTTLYQNGDIVFVYKQIPLIIENITDANHPVKVGLSDAYIIERTVFFVRRKTIFEYHRVNFAKEDIRNWTVIYLKALPTCLQSTDCATCTTKKIPTFLCEWCPAINRCSNGLDRYRQEWIIKKCELKQVENESQCGQDNNNYDFETNLTYSHIDHDLPFNSYAHGSEERIPMVLQPSNQPVKMGVSGIVAIMFLIVMVAGLSLWVLYAYRNPHTTSGQILIRYRPSQWRWRRGEARYTAATIHM